LSDLSIGTRVLGRYRIVRPLGGGGMGVVYLGRMEGAAGFRRPVVIKQVHQALASRQDINEMFAREARILGSLQHSNIVNVIDFGIEAGSYVMVLEYVHGYDLNHWLRLAAGQHQSLKLEYVLYVTCKILAALQHAHEARLPDGAPGHIVHRDVSLSNVLLDLAGQVKLHDFGIARMDDSEAATQAGVFKGKLALAAPEQLQGLKATPQSDIYSTAVLMYQLACGHNPFQGQSEAETIFRIAEHAPPPLSSQRADLPRGLDDVVARALAKSPAARFASAAEFADRLRGFLLRPEDAIVRDLRDQLARDFALIPERLGVESLASRDAAWREAQAASRAVVPLDSFRVTGAHNVAVDRESPPRPSPHKAPRRSDSRLWLNVLPLAAGVVALALLVVATRRPQSEAAGYLVLESPSAAGQASAAAGGDVPTPSPADDARALPASVPQLRAAPTPAAGKPEAPRAAPPARSAAIPAPPNPAELSRQFRKHERDVEACFRNHPDPVVEAGRVSLRFEVSRSGQVTRANALPASAEWTALGRCLLAVARQARFGPLTQPAAFSIPITARRGERAR
jgi:eukaryotic-like serine/threonine-protein kinase